MCTLARLSLFVPCLADDAINEAVEPALAQHLAPVLRRHGLIEPTANTRPPTPGVVSRIYEVADLARGRRLGRELQADPEWPVALERLAHRWGGAVQGGLGLYSTLAGPGRVREAGPGTRRGAWLSLGLADGMLSPVVHWVLPTRDGVLWLSTGDGLSRYDGGRFRHWSAADGLPHALVGALAQTPDGMLWIGSHGGYDFARRGLCRYDGSRFSHFTMADGLPSNAVFGMLVDHTGRLWVGTQGGLYFLDGERFAPAPHLGGPAPRVVVQLAEDRDGVLWLTAVDGIWRYDGAVFDQVPASQLGITPGVWACLADSAGRVWVGGREGLVRREAGGGFTRMAVPEMPGMAAIGPLVEDGSGGIWCSGFPAGVWRQEGERQVCHTPAKGLPNGQVVHGALDADGAVWLATDGGGMARFDGHQLTQMTTADGLLHDTLTCLRYDRQGRLWAGTYGGVCRYDGQAWEPVAPVAHWSQAMIALLEDCRGGFWGVTHAGEVQRQEGSGWVTVLPAPPGSLNNGNLAEAGGGILWCANGAEGVHRYDGQGWVTLTAAQGVPSGRVRCLAAVPGTERVWVGTTLGGVAWWDGERFRTVEPDGGSGEPGGRAILALFVDDQGRLWIGTEGAGLLGQEGDAWRRYTTADGLAADRVLCLGQDPQGRLVAGTQGGGVCWYDGEVFQRFDRQDGLENEVVRGLAFDPDGGYWFATEAGLTHYRPGSQQPRVHLVEVVADELYSLDGRNPAETLKVPDTHPFVRLRCRGESRTTPRAGLAFRYRLQGHDPRWQVSRSSEVTYEHLPLGRYTFEMQAVDRDLHYSEPGRLSLEVVPDPQRVALAQALRTAAPEGQLVAESRGMVEVLALLQRVARTEVTVLLLGETGTGKGLTARTVHEYSDRRDGPFVTVNCSGLPANLVENELFGHESGAYTGAEGRQQGKIGQASGGTLFLDEIGDMTVQAQTRLLHLLQEGTYEPLGGGAPRRADVRVIAATHADLPDRIRKGTFREDLYYRLNTFIVRLPRLADRREDIPFLVDQLLAQQAVKMHLKVPRIDSAALARLKEYDWPGNIRELEGCLIRALVRCRDQVIRTRDLVLDEEPAVAPTRFRAGQTLAEVDRSLIEQRLEEAGGRIEGPDGAAARLGVAASTLRDRMQRERIQRPARKGRGQRAR